MPNHKQLLVANWKMAMPINQALEFIHSFSCSDFLDSNTKMVIAPSFVTLSSLRENISQHSLPIALCAQNCASAESGAFTGEVSVSMLQEVGCEFVLIGHSERRTLFGEAEPVLAKKVDLVIKAGLTPIFCIGEPKEVYESGHTSEYLTRQLSPYSPSTPFILAYEPIWSIGTGLIPTDEDLSCTYDTLRSLFPDTPILYGGSVNQENITGLLRHQTVNGFLVGGASLKPDSFRSLFHRMNQPRSHD